MWLNQLYKTRVQKIYSDNLNKGQHGHSRRKEDNSDTHTGNNSMRVCVMIVCVCVCVCVCVYVCIRVDRSSRICEEFIFTVSERSCRIDDVLSLFDSYEDFKTNMTKGDNGRYNSVARAVQCSTVQYSTVQYSTILYCTVQYSTVHCRILSRINREERNRCRWRRRLRVWITLDYLLSIRSWQASIAERI